MTSHSDTRILESRGEDVERLRVFVAEGNAADLFWLEMVFKGSRLPYTIEVAKDGLAAKQYLEEHAASNPPDLIFLDAFEMLEDLPATERVPFFILTDSMSAAEKEEFPPNFGDASRHFVEKPFTHQKLLDCLNVAALNSWAARLS